MEALCVLGGELEDTNKIQMLPLLRDYHCRDQCMCIPAWCAHKHTRAHTRSHSCNKSLDFASEIT